MLRTLASRCGSASRRFLASRVVNVGSVEAYDKLSTTGDLLVTNFTASWCACPRPAIFDKMSETTTTSSSARSTSTMKIRRLVAAAQVRAVPTAPSRRAATVAGNVQGADMARSMLADRQASLFCGSLAA